LVGRGSVARCRWLAGSIASGKRFRGKWIASKRTAGLPSNRPPATSANFFQAVGPRSATAATSICRSSWPLGASGMAPTGRRPPGQFRETGRNAGAALSTAPSQGARAGALGPELSSRPISRSHAAEKGKPP
jgi:hypothetical protein